MVVSVGMRLQEGPWGGGNQFGSSLAAFLRARGIQVIFDLHHPAIDVILLTEPRGDLRTSAFTDDDIAYYQSRTGHRAVVIHRVNECDERKATTASGGGEGACRGGGAYRAQQSPRGGGG
ncbi:MAG: hypothetical protein IPI01_10645 [Ignavibacteriae bacterium]|nr:hypothetical protein [Ignavibacteriota bacterium]